jgi:hypothetical protein
MKTLGFTAALCATVTAAASSSRADVWEFDRQGNVLVSPEMHRADNEHYDENGFGEGASTPVTQSTRNVHTAIYRPMAEGVAEVYASDPAVTSAGLEETDFVRLFVALIDQESRFNPKALSPKGARGLGQLMPETAEQLGVDPSEPMANLHGAARYLTAQLAEFGRVDWALAAYNAGPHRVEQFHGIPPYRETRDYVARITAAAELADSPASSPARASVGATALQPEIGRALSTALAPELLEPEATEPTPNDQPVQGTVLEWTR